MNCFALLVKPGSAAKSGLCSKEWRARSHPFIGGRAKASKFLSAPGRKRSMPWRLVRRQASVCHGCLACRSCLVHPGSVRGQLWRLSGSVSFSLSAWQRDRELQRPRPQNKKIRAARAIPRTIPSSHTLSHTCDSYPLYQPPRAATSKKHIPIYHMMFCLMWFAEHCVRVGSPKECIPLVP